MKRRTFIKGTAAAITAALVPVLSSKPKRLVIESLVPAVHSLEEVDRLARQSILYEEGRPMTATEVLRREDEFYKYLQEGMASYNRSFDECVIDALQDSTRNLMAYGTSAIKVSYV